MFNRQALHKTALITGASSGIGKELARFHAAEGGDLVLVARREGVLNQLKQELESAYPITVTVVPADLAQADAAEKIFSATEAAGLRIDYLINNAGFGGHGRFFERDLAADREMMQVNMVTLTHLTHLYLQGMVQRRSGKILHVASTAAFIPGPLQAVYYATKAYVVSFSQAIAKELESTGVTSTVLCPGAVATGFAAASNLEGLDVWKTAKSAASVAKCGYTAMIKGKTLVFNETKMKFLLEWIVPFMPRRMVLTLSRRIMEKKQEAV
jgi:short-subunit dehydrogenase